MLERRSVWNAIGRVNVPNGFCTGTLIAPDEVLTAAHCLYDRKRGRLYAPDQVHFVAGWRRGSFTAHARAQRFRVAPDLAFARNGEPRKLETDWAVLKLERPLGEAEGDKGLRPLPVGAAQPDGPFGIIGYGRDRPHLPGRYRYCRKIIPDRDSSVVVHGCAPSQGMSGAPLLEHDDDGWRIVAIHVAIRQDQGLGVAVPVRRVLPRETLR